MIFKIKNRNEGAYKYEKKKKWTPNFLCEKYIFVSVVLILNSFSPSTVLLYLF